MLLVQVSFSFFSFFLYFLLIFNLPLYLLHCEKKKFQDWPALSPTKVHQVYPFELLLQLSPPWTHSLAWSQPDTREGNIAMKLLAWPLSLGFRLPLKVTSFWPLLPQEMQEPKILGSHEPSIGFVLAKENLITTNLSKTKQRTRTYCTNLHLEKKLVTSGHIAWVYVFFKNISIKLVSENQYLVTSNVSNNSPNFPILVFSLTRA